MNWESFVSKHFVSAALGNEITQREVAVATVEIFKDVLDPAVTVTSDGLLHIPDEFSMKIGKAELLYHLMSFSNFEVLPLPLQISVLDLLFLIFRRSPYDVIRFRCGVESKLQSWTTSTDKSLVHVLIELIKKIVARREASNITGRSVTVTMDVPVGFDQAVSAPELAVCKRVIRLLGVVCVTGMTPTEMKAYLQLLNRPSSLSMALLQALKHVVKQEVIENSPVSFFNFGGSGAGFETLAPSAFPFPKQEYQLSFWFRIENREKTQDGAELQHLVSVFNQSYSHGIDVAIVDNCIQLSFFDKPGSESSPSSPSPHHAATVPSASRPPPYLSLQVCHSIAGSKSNSATDGLVEVKGGVWYHLSVKHVAKSRMSFFGRDELIVSVDHQVVYQDSVRYPNIANHKFAHPSEGLFNLSCGVDLNGQMGPIHLFAEGISPNCLEVIARLNANKSVEGISTAYNNSPTAASVAGSTASSSTSSGVTYSNNNISNTSIDSLSSFVVPADRKTVNIAGKISTSFHPSRVHQCGVTGRCTMVDVHGKRHAQMLNKDNSHVWQIPSTRDTLQSMGGILCLLPLWPRLLIEHEEEREKEVGTQQGVIHAVEDTPGGSADGSSQWKGTNVGLGSSIVDVYLDSFVQNGFTSKSLQLLAGDTAELIDDGCLSVLLSLFAASVYTHHVYQSGLMRSKALEMIEYSLLCTPLSIFQQEGESCVLALLNLRSSVNNCKPLEKSLIRHLLVNFKIWSRGSLLLQTHIMSAVFTATRAQPELFTEVVGVQSLLDQLAFCYMDELHVEKGNEDSTPAATAEADATAASEAVVVETPIKNLDYSPPERRASRVPATRRASNFQLLINSALKTLNFSSTENEDTANENRRSSLLDADGIDSKELDERKTLAATNHRKSMRFFIYSMVTVMIANPTEKEMRAILDFIGDCKDAVVLLEIAELLLCLIVEGGSKVLTTIIEACKGVEEFSCFILFRLVNQSIEEIRCCGIRILTHFYVCIMDGNLPPSLLSLSLKSRRGRLLSSVTDVISASATTMTEAMGSSTGHTNGLHRLYLCGGFVLLTEFLSSFCADSSVVTYLALLEIMVSKPGRGYLTIQTVNTLEPIPELQSTPVGNNAPLIKTTSRQGGLGQRRVTFTANFHILDTDDDDFISFVNTTALPLFLHIAPKLPPAVHGRIVSDFLALLKHSEENRDFLFSNLSWHACLYGLVSNLVVCKLNYGNFVEASNVPRVLESWASYTRGFTIQCALANGAEDVHHSNASELLDGIGESVMIPSVGNTSSFGSLGSLLGASTASDEADNVDLDLKFTLGMKLYGTLLLHAMEVKEGWKQVEMAMAQSLDNTEDGHKDAAISQSILSHLLCELTFTIKTKFKRLKDQSQSTNVGLSAAATDQLESLLSVIVVSSMFMLNFPVCSVKSDAQLLVARKRVELISLVETERQKKCTYVCDESVHNDICMPSSTLCVRCGHCLSVHSTLCPVTVEAEQRLVVWYHLTVANKDFDEDGDAEDDVNSSGEDYSVVDVPSSEPAEPAGEKESLYTWIDLSGRAAMPANFTGVVGNMSPAKGYQQDSDFPVNPSDGEGDSSLPGMHRTPSTATIKRINDDELIHPLERSYTTEHSRLVVALQTLRFFDYLFWPENAVQLRNVQMLEFQMAYSLPPSATAPKNSVGNATYPLTLISSVVRLSWFVLSEISPFSDMAELNIRRLRVCMASISRVPVSTTPVDALVINTILCVFRALQQVYISLRPVYDMLGVSHDPDIDLCGMPEDAQVTADRQKQSDGVFEKSVEDPVVYNHLELLFDTDAGRKFISFIKCSFYLLLDIYEQKKKMLSGVLSNKMYVAFTVLIGLVKVDKARSFAGPTDSAESMGGLAGEAPGSPSRRAAGGTGADVDVALVNIASLPNQQKKRLSRSASDKLSSGNDSENNSEDFNTTNSASNSEDGKEEKSSARKAASSAPSEGTAAPSVSSPVSNLSGLPSSLDSNCIFGAHVVTALRWLRDPFLQLDLLRSTGVVEYVNTMETLEIDALAGFRKNMKNHKDSLLEQSDLHAAQQEESHELTQLALAVSGMMSTREQLRQTARNAFQTDRIRVIAGLWHSCLEVFEGQDWSPFCESEGDTGEERFDVDPANIWFELSRHRDDTCRRMHLTKASESVDHSNSAYFEGKQQMNALLENTDIMEEGVTGAADRIKNKSLNNSQLNRKFTTSFNPKSLLKASSATFSTGSAGSLPSGDAWGDDDDDGSTAGSLDGMDPDDAAERTRSSSTAAFVGSLLSNTGKSLSLGGGVSGEQRPAWTRSFDWSLDERTLVSWEVHHITLAVTMMGTLLLTNKRLYFRPRKQSGGLLSHPKPDHTKSCSWQLDRISGMYGRRYLLKNSGIEIFFVNCPEVCFSFATTADLQKFSQAIRRQTVPHLSTPRSLNPRQVMSSTSWTDLWRRRQITNFEYLMRLNTISGRSYNDITQYPVFPWILSDYTSETIDLKDPSIYRDLSKPVGAINEVKLSEIMDRYSTFDDEEVPKFMYGSHYSSAGVVLHFMVRQEPFTSLSSSLQGGRFDCPDRMFFDFNSAWVGVNNSISDVKELIPEMFCLPEAFINSNKLPLGELQDGQVVNDVVLPKWANNDPHEFIRIHREALESDYVSEHLHEWIDLIWGYKQIGQAAVDAKNVFYYLTYENAFKGGGGIDAIGDSIHRDAVKAQVTHFGQTPSQLFTRQHPVRYSLSECTNIKGLEARDMINLKMFLPAKQYGLGTSGAMAEGVSATGSSDTIALGAVLHIHVCKGSDRVAVVYADLSVATYRWGSFPDIADGTPFTFKPSYVKRLPSVLLSSLDSTSSVTVKGDNSLTDPAHIDFPIPTASTSATSSSEPVQRPVSTRAVNMLRYMGGFSRSTSSSSSSSTPVASPMNKGKAKTLPTTPEVVAMPVVEVNTTAAPTAITTPSPISTPAKGKSSGGTPIARRMSKRRSSSFVVPPPPPLPIPIAEECTEDKDKEDVQQNEDGLAERAMIRATDSQQKTQVCDGQLKTAARDMSLALHSPMKGHDGQRKELAMLRGHEVRGSSTIAVCSGDGHTTPRVISCGYWDHSLRLHSLDSTLKEVSNTSRGHIGQITCVCTSQTDVSVKVPKSSMCVTGGVDGTCRVWSVEHMLSGQPSTPLHERAAGMMDEGKGDGLVGGPAVVALSTSAIPSHESLACLHVLTGHDTPITALCYSYELDLVLSASKSGLLCIHFATSGVFVRSMKDLVNRSIDLVFMCPSGDLVAQSLTKGEGSNGDKWQLHLFNLNGKLQKSVSMPSRITKMKSSNSSGNNAIIVCGTADGELQFRRIGDLEMVHCLEVSLGSAISSLSFTDDKQHILIGGQNGLIRVCTDPVG